MAHFLIYNHGRQALAISPAGQTDSFLFFSQIQVLSNSTDVYSLSGQTEKGQVMKMINTFNRKL